MLIYKIKKIVFFNLTAKKPLRRGHKVYWKRKVVKKGEEFI